MRLERVAEISKDEAKKELMDSLVEEVKHESAKQIKQIEDATREIADKKGKLILALAIQRYSGDYVAERTVSIVNLPNDEMKGRIIGREGRNIRALEAATGVDLIIDDTPEAVLLSAHNPIRREIAKVSLERLISDGRIHPGRIEEIVKKVEEEMEENIREIGEQATVDVGVHGIHRFVLNQIGMGILYLLTGGICLIGTIVDLVNYQRLTFEFNQPIAQQAAMMVKGPAPAM